MAEYKLYYLNLKGRAEMIRLMFAAAGQKYEDIRFTRDEWNADYKAKSPFGQCPYLEVKEGNETFTLAQSIAIARYLGRKLGFAGKNEKESALIDMYADQLTDLVNEWISKVFREQDEQKKKEADEKFNTETAPATFKFFEEQIAKSGSGFLVSSGLSWFDFYLYQIVDWNPKKDIILSKFKHIQVSREKIAAIPGVANWLKIRPATDL